MATIQWFLDTCPKLEDKYKENLKFVNFVTVLVGCPYQAKSYVNENC